MTALHPLTNLAIRVREALAIIQAADADIAIALREGHSPGPFINARAKAMQECHAALRVYFDVSEELRSLEARDPKDGNEAWGMPCL